MMEVKGTAVSVMPEFLQARHGAEGLERWRATLSPEARQIFSNPIFSNVWFPLDRAFIEPTTKVCELFYGGDTAGAVEVGRFSADRALRGIYKFFVKIGSTKALLEMASSVFSTYYRPSRMELASMGDGEARLLVVEFADMHRVVEARIAGWIARCLEISGCRDVRVTIPESRARGDHATRYDIAWQ